MLCQLKTLDSQVAGLQYSELSQVDKLQQVHQLSRDRVALLSKFLSRAGHRLGREGLEILIPYVLTMFEDPLTSIQAVWSMFNPVSQALGPRETAHQLMSHLVLLFDAEFTTIKHMKLYHRSFIIQLLIRLGMEVFLHHFSTLLIEACAGFKNFAGQDEYGHRCTDSDFFDQRYGVGGEYPEVFVDGAVETENGNQQADPDDRPDIPMGDEVIHFSRASNIDQHLICQHLIS